jgi:hypothetical protein
MSKLTEALDSIEKLETSEDTAQSACNGLLCDRECNECPLILHDNSRMLTKILNEAYKKFGNDFYHIVQKHCPNMTCCADCHVDDFCHFEGCELIDT